MGYSSLFNAWVSSSGISKGTYSVYILQLYYDVNSITFGWFETVSFIHIFTDIKSFLIFSCF